MQSSFLVIGAALLLAACDPTSTVPEALIADTGASAARASSDAAALAPEGPGLPFKGSCDLTIESIEFAFPIRTQRDTGTCQLSQLGRATVDGVLRINVQLQTQEGTRTFTAANGDKLYANVQGTSTPIGDGLIAFEANLTFTGGTGRFTNATGTAQGRGVASPSAATTSVTFTGQIRK